MHCMILLGTVPLSAFHNIYVEEVGSSTDRTPGFDPGCLYQGPSEHSQVTSQNFVFHPSVYTCDAVPPSVKQKLHAVSRVEWIREGVGGARLRGVSV